MGRFFPMDFNTEYLKKVEQIFSHQKVPFLISLTYLVYVVVKNRAIEKNGQPVQKSRNMKIFIFLHNFLLFIYSLYTFRAVHSVLKIAYEKCSLLEFLSDKYKIISEGTRKHVFYFYLSKYWEIFDTLLIHMLNRKSSFLQYYHHVGAIISMYSLYISKLHIAWIFVYLNSFVHTIMYFYYMLSSYIQVLRFVKVCVTVLQLVQFISGYVILFYHMVSVNIFSEDVVLKKLQIKVIWGLVFYVFVLLYLFFMFFKMTYMKNKVKKE